MKTYCAFCKTGSENTVAQKINLIDKDVVAVAPKRVIQEKRKGKWEPKEKALLPGYVFIFSEQDLNTFLVNKVSDLYKVLNYDSNVRELTGKDYEYSMWIWRHHGTIDTSKVLTEGKEVKVIEGPLMDVCGVIKKLDKHKRKAWVDIEFDGTVRSVVFSAESIDTKE